MTKDNKKITEKEMEDSILRSGYLLEQRVEVVLEKNAYFVTTNDAYPDPVTGKSREIDINALSAFKLSKDYDFLFSRFLCECENNHQPVVFFVKDSPVSFLNSNYLKCAGLPVQFINNKDIPVKGTSQKSNYRYIDLPDFLNIEKFHHYCKDPVSSQYCSFNRKNDKSPWIAYHEETHHNSLNNLIFALEAKIDDYYDDYIIPEKDETDQINIDIYYPVLILQGPLHSARIQKGKLKLKKEKHIRYIKEYFSKDKKDTYIIDVITEKYLSKYLKVIEEEMTRMQNKLKRKKKIVRASLDTLVEKAKKKKKTETFRDIFEF